MYYHLQGKSLYYNDNIHHFQDMTVCTPTEKYMYTNLNQNMKICVNPNLTPCLYLADPISLYSSKNNQKIAAINRAREKPGIHQESLVHHGSDCLILVTTVLNTEKIGFFSF